MIFTKSIKGRYLFRRIFKKGKYVSNSNITVYVLKNIDNDEENYLGICVSKKHGNSVVRNKLKRWAKEVYKTEEKDLKSGYFIVILYKKDVSVENINFDIVKNEFKECMKGQEMYR